MCDGSRANVVQLPWGGPGAPRALDASSALPGPRLRCGDLVGVLRLHRLGSWRSVRGIMLVIWISWVYWDRELRRDEPSACPKSPSETNSLSGSKLMSHVLCSDELRQN